MKKLSSLVLAVVLLAGVLVGCNGAAASEVKTYNMDDIVAAVEEANPVSNPRAVDDNFIMLDMMLTKDNIAEYTGKVSNDGGNSALIVVLKANEGKVADLKAEMESYKTNISTGGLYAEFADMETMAKGARIVEKGDYLVMVVANTQGADYAEIDKALDAALA